MMCNNQIRRSVINAHAGVRLNSVHVEVAQTVRPAMSPRLAMRPTGLTATGRRASAFDGFRTGESDAMSKRETSKRCSQERHSTVSPKVAELPAAIWAALAIQRALST
jgi:hypothetical protein